MLLDTAYDLWDLGDALYSRAESPHCLKPQGIGTAQVESLSGYISRFGGGPRSFLSEISWSKSLKQCPEWPLQADYIFRSRPSPTFFMLRPTVSMECAGRQATGFACLRSATHRRPPLADPVSPHEGRLNMVLLRKCRAWCPYLYQEDQLAGPMY